MIANREQLHVEEERRVGRNDPARPATPIGHFGWNDQSALATDPRLAGLEVTQLVVEDGWIATAIGPARMTAKRDAMNR